MVGKRSRGCVIFGIFNFLFMLVIISVIMYPTIHILFASLSDNTQLLAKKGLILKPCGFTLNAYRLVFRHPLILSGYLNTAFIIVFGVALNLVVTSIGAYCLSHKNLMWHKAMMIFVIITMLFSGGMIPLFLLIKDLRLTDSLWSLILPFLVSTYYLMIMKTYFENIPKSIIESARIDGLSEFNILFKIVIPLSYPILAVMVLYYAVDKWNGWFYASVFIIKRNLYPLQLVMRGILLQNETSDIITGNGDVLNMSETLKYAAVVVATAPILCVYPMLQKFFITGSMIGAVKE